MSRLLRSLFLLTVVALGIGVSSSLAGRSGDATATDDAAVCKEQLEEAREAVRTTDQMLALAKKKKLVLIQGWDSTITPWDPDKFAEWIITLYVTNRITKDRLAKGLVYLARAARTTVPALIALGNDAREERDRIAKRCGSLEQDDKSPVPAKAGTGDLRRTGLPVVGPDQTGGLPFSWTVDATGATVETAAGSATFSWALPVTITKAGAEGRVTVKTEPGKGGERSNLAASIRAVGEVTFLCGAEKKPCPMPEAGAHTTEGKSPSATMTFTIKPNQYSAGRKEPVLIQIQLGPNGRTVTYKYDIVD